MFVDEKSLTVTSGKGGDGAVLFRHEKYVPNGGPDGGDGGKGGSVYIEGHDNLHTLSHLAHVDHIKAENGQGGGHKKSTGKSGEDATINVPLGTQVYVLDPENDRRELVAEILQEGDRIRIVKGGNGGWGNWHFRSSVQQAPDHANPGQPAEKKQILFVLKLIADIGLIGLPNAGKSTLLSVISAAKPKIANYPFTTLEPQLGVAEVKQGRDTYPLVVADLPGLIEGAHTGKGLGMQFLKHLERTKAIIHCIDSSMSEEEIKDAYETIRHELTEWSNELGSKPEIIALTKIDTILPEDAERVATYVRSLGSSPVFLISAATHKGLHDLLTSAYNLIF